MQKFGAFLFCLLFISCEFFTSPKEAKEQILKRERQSINWNDVDQYPLFETCDETAEREVQYQCFQETFTAHFYKTLAQEQLVVHKTLNDTIKVQLLIGKEGHVSILQIKKNKKVAKEIPQIDTLIAHSVKTMPKVYPALKRNIPVNMKIQLPIILTVE
ncbi:hypothetical protein OOZ15_02380 [Galbibacter sp. EGI 63066]|uniref:hypothetical protein n=1 Tax=Galbibacter sp. EGI 63066 TaxID=2993559 RepID=UPI00224933D2|nr:hypothetical protein [Galbibacter sp. EGI 63066]MCX2678776.1 hypothetical protein [Galbibacter sp. EGI 63066]